MSRISAWLHRDAAHLATAQFYAEVEKQRASREEMDAAAQGLKGAADRLTESAHVQRGRINAELGDKPGTGVSGRTSEVRQLVESTLRRMEATDMRTGQIRQ